jgi:outer membrane receptor for ferrienterochelin and colicins
MKILVKLTMGILLLPVALFSNSNEIKGKVSEKENLQVPLPGANVYWAETQSGNTTDEEGKFELERHNEIQKLVVSFVGYINDTIDVLPHTEELSIQLNKNVELDEVTINERQKGVYHSKLNPIQTQKITTTELQKAACCNLSESFETNASVDVTYSDAVTGAKQIQMLGLSGTYVQTLSEAMPSVRGMASSYGLGYIPGPWMESIQISKGTSSVVNGYEAITGQINVEYKKPDADERFHFNLFVSDEAKVEANLNAAIDVSEDVSTMVLLHAENHSKEIDNNGDRFLDLPHIKQINFINRWEFKGHDGRHKQIGIKILDETRMAGQVGAKDDITGNLYGIEIGTQRYELFTKNGYVFHKSGNSLGMQFSANYHNQDAVYGHTTFNGTQYTGYFNLIYEGKLGSDLHSYITGVSIFGDQYKQNLKSTETDFSEIVPGSFFQYTYCLLDHFSLIAGIRADYSSLHGLFITPRLHAKANLGEWFVVRASAGKGYRTALPLAENTYLMASSRNIIIDNDLKQEEAYNFGGNFSAFIPIYDKELNISLDYFRTQFVQQVIRNMDSDAHAIRFMNLEGISYSNSIQAEINYEIIDGLTAVAAYRINDAKQTIDGVTDIIPLNQRYRGLLSLSYTTLNQNGNSISPRSLTVAAECPCPMPIIRYGTKNLILTTYSMHKFNGTLESGASTWAAKTWPGTKCTIR